MSTTPLAIICDLDGLLVDSEELHFLAYRDILLPYGVEITRQMFVDSWLSSKHYGLKFYLEKIGITAAQEIEEIRQRKSDRFITIAAGKLEPMPGAIDFLKRIKAANLPCGLGTGSYQREYDFMVTECGLKHYIQVFIGNDDVGGRNKPAPDIFLKVAEKLNIQPQNCLVFENSEIGILAAQKAGMKCFIVPSPFTKKQNFLNATKVLQSLAEYQIAKS